MPVYNEGASIEQAVQNWMSEVEPLGIRYEFRVYDDGSRDNTEQVLRALAANRAHLHVTRHANIGHGPTILRGYREARGEWVFQTDSDGEMDVKAFRTLWDQRESYDFLVGSRHGRDSPVTRRLVTAVSRLSVRLLFGQGIRDVNSPYRLMRATRLRELLGGLPIDLFAPNVILSGLAARNRLRMFETHVPHTSRQHGRSSLNSLTILRPAARSLVQTVRAAWHARVRKAS
jgi:dolichol-phosphate mannosyltransferase